MQKRRGLSQSSVYSELSESSNRQRRCLLPHSLHPDSLLLLWLSQTTGMEQRQELEPVAHLLRISQHAVPVNELSSGGGVFTASQQNLSEKPTHECTLFLVT